MNGLSKDFTLLELTHTDTGLLNVPNVEQVMRLLYLANYLLQPIRDRFGRVDVSSAFRSEEVNKAVGGNPKSQHLMGEAADFIVKDLDACFEWCRKNLVYGQCILESSMGREWIHISLPRLGGMNQQALRYENGTYADVSNSSNV